MDVTTAFLYASLDEEVYMELMEGMDGYGTPGKVARLWKAIYGLKQASWMWNLHIDNIPKSMGVYEADSRPRGLLQVGWSKPSLAGPLRQ